MLPLYIMLRGVGLAAAAAAGPEAVEVAEHSIHAQSRVQWELAYKLWQIHQKTKEDSEKTKVPEEFSISLCHDIDSYRNPSQLLKDTISKSVGKFIKEHPEALQMAKDLAIAFNDLGKSINEIMKRTREGIQVISGSAQDLMRKINEGRLQTFTRLQSSLTALYTASDETRKQKLIELLKQTFQDKIDSHIFNMTLTAVENHTSETLPGVLYIKLASGLGDTLVYKYVKLDGTIQIPGPGSYAEIDKLMKTRQINGITTTNMKNKLAIKTMVLLLERLFLYEEYGYDLEIPQIDDQERRVNELFDLKLADKLKRDETKDVEKDKIRSHIVKTNIRASLTKKYADEIRDSEEKIARAKEMSQTELNASTGEQREFYSYLNSIPEEPSLTERALAAARGLIPSMRSQNPATHHNAESPVAASAAAAQPTTASAAAAQPTSGFIGAVTDKVKGKLKAVAGVFSHKPAAAAPPTGPGGARTYKRKNKHFSRIQKRKGTRKNKTQYKTRKLRR
jgi:hypothetical protein